MGAHGDRPLDWTDLALLLAVDGGFRDRLLANLRQTFAGANAKADDYALAGPGEGE